MKSYEQFQLSFSEARNEYPQNEAKRNRKRNFGKELSAKAFMFRLITTKCALQTDMENSLLFSSF